MFIRRQACNENVGLALGVYQMAKVTGMHHVEYTVAHDDLLLARARAENSAKLFERS